MQTRILIHDSSPPYPAACIKWSKRVYHFYLRQLLQSCLPADSVGPELQTQDSRSKSFYFWNNQDSGAIKKITVKKRDADDADNYDLL